MTFRTRWQGNCLWCGKEISWKTHRSNAKFCCERHAWNARAGVKRRKELSPEWENIATDNELAVERRVRKREIAVTGKFLALLEAERDRKRIPSSQRSYESGLQNVAELVRP